MKKEKTVKTYQRRTKSGKVVTVRQHTAKYDAADKAAEASKKKGSGDELESLKKSKTMDTPVEISKDDFKEWYNFNEWDTPKKEWPESVKKVDSHLRKTMGKKGYDDYCAKIDESWSARGHLKAYKDFSSESKSKPKPLFTKKGVVSQVNEEPKKVNHIDKDFMDVYNNKIKKGTYDRMSDYKDQNDFRYKEVLKELKGRGYKIKEHSKWESPDGESYSLLDVTDPNGKKIASNAHSAAGSGHLLFLEKLAFGKQSKAVTRQKGTPVFDTNKKEAKTKKLTAKDYQSMSDEELQKHWDKYRPMSNVSLSRSERNHKHAIYAEMKRRSEDKTKAEEKSARKAVGGLVSGSTWKYNSSDGSFSTSYSTAWGRPDSSRVKKILQKAEDSGWKKADHSSSMQPDDKFYRRTERYVSPDGKYELTYRYQAGDFSSNSHYVTIRRTKSEKTPTKEDKK